MKGALSLPARGLTYLVQLYQRFISPWLSPRCRFHPTCSDYAIAVIAKDGALKGSGRAILRILRCHPLHPGGFDPP